MPDTEQRACETEAALQITWQHGFHCDEGYVDGRCIAIVFDMDGLFALEVLPPDSLAPTRTTYATHAEAKREAVLWWVAYLA